MKVTADVVRWHIMAVEEDRTEERHRSRGRAGVGNPEGGSREGRPEAGGRRAGAPS